MSRVTAEITISLDGFAAGPNQTEEQPLGEGGERLHEWVLPTESWRRQHGKEGGEKGPDDDAAAEFGKGVGAYIMGRNMFGPPGGGERLLENVGDPTLEPIDVVASPAATHVKYRVVR